MNDKDIGYLNELVSKYREYKSPTDTQRLLVELGSKSEKTDDDNKKLMILMRAEKKAEALHKARQKTRDLLQSEKKAERKKETHKKVIWGSALKTAAKDNAQIANVMRFLYDNGFVSERDKDAVKADYDALTATQNSNL
jgi:hypothetical protein